jgi:beta-glucosidase
MPRDYPGAFLFAGPARGKKWKDLKIAVKKSQPMSIMSSYNLLNGTHTANSYDLLTAAARDEWGFEGIVMTDWGTTGHLGFPDQDKHKYPVSSSAQCIKAGNDLIMPGSQADFDDIMASVDASAGTVPYPITLGDLQFCTKNILKLIMQSNCYENTKPYAQQYVLEEFVKVSAL